MSASAIAAFAAIGYANLVFCKQWIRVSAWTFEHAHQVTQDAFEAFVERPLAATQVIAVRAAAAARSICESESAGSWAVHAELFGPLPHRLPCLVAEYAGDMDSIAETR
jgi:hypothetical protein